MSSVLFVVGARPNFVKVAPVLVAARAEGLDCPLLHTGQHYDSALSDSFLEQLALPEPVAYLKVGSGSHAEQTAAVMIGVERHLRDCPADAVLVAGDVNSTLAAALAANLRREGIDAARMDVVGNTMIDTLLAWLPEVIRPRNRDGARPGAAQLRALHATVHRSWTTTSASLRRSGRLERSPGDCRSSGRCTRGHERGSCRTACRHSVRWTISASSRSRRRPGS